MPLTDLRFDYARFARFLGEALAANVSYIATRRRLFTLFVESIRLNGEIFVPVDNVVQIRTFLSSRPTEQDNNSRLAYEVAILALLALRLEYEDRAPSGGS